jgi:hypothetical protein
MGYRIEQCVNKWGSEMKSNSNFLQSTVSAAVLALMAGSAQAAISEAEAAKLGKELTFVGAERAGNKDGTIPEFKGGTPKGTRKLTDPRVDPFAADKPLFSIDATNVDKYKDKLTAGQIELLKTRKGYRMDVYPTRRSAAAIRTSSTSGPKRVQPLPSYPPTARRILLPDSAVPSPSRFRRTAPRRSGTTSCAGRVRVASSTTRPIS